MQKKYEFATIFSMSGPEDQIFSEQNRPQQLSMIARGIVDLPAIDPESGRLNSTIEISTRNPLEAIRRNALRDINEGDSPRKVGNAVLDDFEELAVFAAYDPTFLTDTLQLNLEEVRTRLRSGLEDRLSAESSTTMGIADRSQRRFTADSRLETPESRIITMSKFQDQLDKLEGRL